MWQEKEVLLYCAAGLKQPVEAVAKRLADVMFELVDGKIVEIKEEGS